ncbi:MAG: transcription antitermination factor NusB, partial [Comamonadaceae bacterium]|nr:transcription antitermination factor NusB [Comamonadaceae bacterium]
VRDCLRVSCYELLFLDNPAHVAVDQGVELVSAVQPRARRLANSVLRKMAAAKESFPYGDVETSDEALARSLGFPYWLCEELVSWLGRAEAAQFMAASNQPAPLFFATNAIKLEDEGEFRRGLGREGVQSSPVRLQSDGEALP